MFSSSCTGKIAPRIKNEEKNPQEEVEPISSPLCSQYPGARYGIRAGNLANMN